MRVLVTGGSGFLGRHIVTRLRTDTEVLSLSRSGTGPDAVVGDVLDPASLAEAMAGCDAVVHAAGAVSHDPADARRMWDVHVVGTQNVLAAAREAGVRRIVHLSSSGTVAVSKDPDVRDEASPTPNDLVSQWPYYRAKLYSEQIALATKGIEVVSLNPSLLLGPGDRERRSVRVVESHLEGWLRAIPPGGLSFVDARDVAEAVASALVRGTPGRRYLLGAANWTFADFYGRIARISGIPAPSFKLPRIASRALPWLGNMDVSEYTGGVDRWELDLACRFWYLDARRARHELGWEPRDPMDTLQDTVDDLRGHRIR